MATPNYGYEKRQRELAKKQKKEEKLRAKADRKSTDPSDPAGGEDLPQAGELDPQATVQPGESASASS